MAGPEDGGRSKDCEKGGTEFRAELIAVKTQSLLLRGEFAAGDTALEIDEIRDLIIV